MLQTEQPQEELLDSIQSAYTGWIKNAVDFKQICQYMKAVNDITARQT